LSKLCQRYSNDHRPRPWLFENVEGGHVLPPQLALVVTWPWLDEGSNECTRTYSDLSFFVAVRSSSCSPYLHELNEKPDFDFLIGEWRMYRHRLKPYSQECVDFEGMCTNNWTMEFRGVL